MSLRVETQFRPGTMMVDIWIVRDVASGTLQTVVVGEDTWEDREVGPFDGAPPPSLTLPGDIFKALVAAGSDILPPSASTERHLQDAIKVRDRLLDTFVVPQDGER